mgnify:CR=1 FL=1
MADLVANLVAETATCTGSGGTYNGSWGWAYRVATGSGGVLWPYGVQT